MTRPIHRTVNIAALLLTAGLASAPAASAQDFSRMSCEALWYARNEIFARSGYCFQSARALSAFGPGCFPPFGKLSAEDDRTVATIRSWERSRKCPP
jgi:hypothetical protein